MKLASFQKIIFYLSVFLLERVTTQHPYRKLLVNKA